MVFKRRDKRTLGRQVWEAFFPKKGWRRAFEYIGHRIKRLPDTPHKIALGFACGIFVSFSPLFGFHFVYAALCALIVRGNMLAALSGTFFGNPLTFPLIATVSYRLGHDLLGLSVDEAEVLGLMDAIFAGVGGTWHSFLSLFGLSEPAWADVNEFFKGVVLPYFVGGIIPGLVTSVVCYFLSRPLIAAYQARRRLRLHKKRAEKHRRVVSPSADTAQ